MAEARYKANMLLSESEMDKHYNWETAYAWRRVPVKSIKDTIEVSAVMKGTMGSRTPNWTHLAL